MTDLTAKQVFDLVGYIRILQIQERIGMDSDISARDTREKGSPQYEQFEASYYGHLHTCNVLAELESIIIEMTDF